MDRINVISGILGLVVMMLLSGCATTTPSRFHSTHLPTATKTLVQITQFATREEILSITTLVETLELSGIQQVDIKDNRVASGRIFCCGGTNETDYAIWFYVPEGSDVILEEVVEIEMGAIVHSGDPMRAPPNTFRKVRAHKDQLGSQCKWTPEKPNLWGRVLYCDWMEEEGWEQQEGMFNVWYKPRSKKTAP